MMQKVCDVCGNRMATRYEDRIYYRFVAPRLYRIHADINGDERDRMDICTQCYIEFVKLLKET